MAYDPGYKKPSKRWELLLYPLTSIMIMATSYYFYQLVFLGQTDFISKQKLIWSFLGLFASGFFLLQYRYSVWAAAAKCRLKHLYRRDRSVIYFEYGRYYINEEQIKRYGEDPSELKRLNQRDLRDVFGNGSK